MIETNCLPAIRRGDIKVPLSGLFGLDSAEEAYGDAIAVQDLGTTILGVDLSLFGPPPGR